MIVNLNCNITLVERPNGNSDVIVTLTSHSLCNAALYGKMSDNEVLDQKFQLTLNESLACIMYIDTIEQMDPFVK